MESPNPHILGLAGRGWHKSYQENCGAKCKWYTQNIYYLMQVAVPHATPHEGLLAPNSHPGKQRILHIFSAGASMRPPCGSGVAKSVRRSLLLWINGGLCFPGKGGGGAQLSALDYIVPDSVYIIYILPCNFPGTSHSLPCCQGQECGGFRGFPRNKFNTFGNKRVRGIQR